MSDIRKYTKAVLRFARQEACSFVISALLSMPVALLSSATWLNTLGRNYSFKTLFSTAPVVFTLIIWIVWLITRKFLIWIKTKHIKLNWQDYIALGIALIPLFAAVYYGWSSYSDRNILSTFYSTFEVEITSWANVPGNICVLEIKNQSVGMAQKENSPISGLSLTGNWTADNDGCQYFSPGSTPGSLKFNYVGIENHILEFLFREGQEAAKALIYVNGEQVAGIDLFAEQEGSKLITTPVHLSQLDMFIWNTIRTAGWFAALVVPLMILALLIKNIRIPAKFITIFTRLESKPWISLIPVIIVAVFMFWPRGFFTSPDVAYYLSLAKNLYHGNGYVNPDLSPNVYRGPVLPLLISFSYVLFGESFRSSVIMERVFWLLSVLVSYLLGRHLYNHRVGILAAFFILTANVINETFIRIWTDGPLTFAILALQLMLWHAFKKQRGGKSYAFIGMFMGAAYLLKQSVIFIAPLPLLIWIISSEHRNRQTFKKLLILYFTFALFYFGWDGYVYLAGGSSGQITGTIKTGINFLSYISRGLSLASAGQNLVTQEEITKTSSIMPFLDPIDKFYTRDILKFFRIAVVFPVALSFTLYQAVVKKIKSDIFLILGLFLHAPLILVQAVVNFGYRQNLYFYCTVLILIAAMLDRMFGKLSSKGLSNVLVMTVAGSLIFIQISGGKYTFPESVPVKNQDTLDYFNDYQEIATWVDKYINPDVKIMISSRESNYLHILTAGNRQFEITNTCMGDVGFSPPIKCSPPYISFWVYRGTTDPNQPRDFLQGISETSLLSTISEKEVMYVFVTPSIYSLYNYLKVHPDFEEIDIIDNFAIFQVIEPVQPMSNYPNLKWNTCIGNGTPEYLKNLKETDPARYERKLYEEIGPWMGLNRKDLESFMNWQGCQFEVNFPGSYSSP